MVRKFVLVSSDDEKFPTEQKVMEKSNLLKNMLKDLFPSDEDDEEEEDDDEPTEIPLPNVSSSVMRFILEWCEHYKDEEFDDDLDDDSKKSAPIAEWDKNFLSTDQEMLYEIILAANYLNIKPLLNAGCKMVAEMIRGKSPDEIRKTFNIVNDFTAEEEAAIKRENEWAEDR